mmetsp:Transcript_16485/g.45341  ORF Transcript_16485/g.45341 Transcript_16485/m.45341 type:complete len:200 (+) Transcript_16485:1065-1664(+)
MHIDLRIKFPYHRIDGTGHCTRQHTERKRARAVHGTDGIRVVFIYCRVHLIGKASSILVIVAIVFVAGTVAPKIPVTAAQARQARNGSSRGGHILDRFLLGQEILDFLRHKLQQVPSELHARRTQAVTTHTLFSGLDGQAVQLTEVRLLHFGFVDIVFSIHADCGLARPTQEYGSTSNVPGHECRNQIFGNSSVNVVAK